jgi:hypothetical protein
MRLKRVGCEIGEVIITEPEKVRKPSAATVPQVPRVRLCPVAAIDPISRGR